MPMPLLFGGHDCGTRSTGMPSFCRPSKGNVAYTSQPKRETVRGSGITKTNGKIHKTIWCISLSGDHRRRKIAFKKSKQFLRQFFKVRRCHELTFRDHVTSSHKSPWPTLG